MTKMCMEGVKGDTNLCLTRTDDTFHEVPGLRYGRGSHGDALVAQKENLGVAQVSANGSGLCAVRHHARVVVITHVREQLHGLRTHWQQTRLYT